MNEIIELRIDQLKPGDNPREIDFNKDEDMATLLSTMEKVGYEGIDPILVYKTEFVGTYEIDDGHRRFHCACKMEWKKLRAIEVPRPRTEADKFFKRGLRNLNQKKLTNGELVRFVGRLHNDFEWTQDQIAKDTNLSQSHVSRLCTVHTFPILLEYIDNNGQIKIAYELAKINDIVVMQQLLNQDTLTFDMVKQHRWANKPKEKEEDAEKPKETPLEGEREASTQEELDKLAGHASEVSSVHPIQNTGKSEGDGGEDPNPLENAPPLDGEPGKTEPEKLEDDANPQPVEVTPESSPSKNGWKHGYYHSACGTFLEDGTDKIISKRNNHTCKDITTLLRRTDVLLSDFVETKILPGEKTSDFLIRDAYGPHKLSDERLNEALIHAREVKRKAPIVLTALENLERFNGRMKVS